MHSIPRPLSTVPLLVAVLATAQEVGEGTLQRLPADRQPGVPLVVETGAAPSLGREEPVASLAIAPLDTDREAPTARTVPLPRPPRGLPGPPRRSRPQPAQEARRGETLPVVLADSLTPSLPVLRDESVAVVDPAPCRAVRGVPSEAPRPGEEASRLPHLHWRSMLFSYWRHL